MAELFGAIETHIGTIVTVGVFLILLVGVARIEVDKLDPK